MTSLIDLQKALDKYLVPQKQYYDFEVRRLLIKVFSAFQKDYELSLAKERSLRKLLEDPVLLEKLASLEHQQWSMLMAYVKSVSIEEKDIVEQLQSKWQEWRELANTPYAQLTEKQKESDRMFARDVLRVFGEAFSAKGVFSAFQKDYELSLAKERSLRKLWEEFDLDDYDNDDVIEWYNESKKVFAEDFAAESSESVDKSFIQVSRKQLSELDGTQWLIEHEAEIQNHFQRPIIQLSRGQILGYFIDKELLSSGSEKTEKLKEAQK